MAYLPLVKACATSLCVVLLLACGEPPPTVHRCVESAPAPEMLPHVAPDEQRIAHWLGEDADRSLLSIEQLASLERALAASGHGGRGPLALLAPIDEGALATSVRTRLSVMEARARAGELTGENGARLSIAALRDLDTPASLPPFHPEIRLALEPVPMRCTPRAGPLSSGDARFDRNLCSTLAAQEPVQLLLRWPNGSFLARTSYVDGWLDGTAHLSPAIDDASARALFTDPRVLVPGSEDPLPIEGSLVVRASTEGLDRSARPPDAIDVPRALTRHAFLQTVFAHLGEPYGWGGREGRHDCSSLVQHAFGTFGLHVPRNSRAQAQAGSAFVDLRAGDDDATRNAAITAAAGRGIVLLTFPGHVMIYLGSGADGTPRVLHALAEYVEPCEGGGETLRLVDRVVVSDLSLGRGSSRRSLLQRITRIVIFGPP